MYSSTEPVFVSLLRNSGIFPSLARGGEEVGRFSVYSEYLAFRNVSTFIYIFQEGCHPNPQRGRGGGEKGSLKGNCAFFVCSSGFYTCRSGSASRMILVRSGRETFTGYNHCYPGQCSHLFVLNVFLPTSKKSKNLLTLSL
jgi:hypothetical protein